MIEPPMSLKTAQFNQSDPVIMSNLCVRCKREISTETILRQEIQQLFLCTDVYASRITFDPRERAADIVWYGISLITLEMAHFIASTTCKLFSLYFQL